MSDSPEVQPSVTQWGDLPQLDRALYPDDELLVVGANGIAYRADKAKLGLPADVMSEPPVTFDQDREYGSWASPLSGTVNVSLEGAIRGRTATLYVTGQNFVLSVADGTAKVHNSTAYDPDKVNVVLAFWAGASIVVYGVFPDETPAP